MPSARRKHARPQPRRLLDQDKLDALQALANDTSTVTTYGDSPYHRVLKRLGKFYAKYRVEILKEPEVDPEDPIPRVPTEREHHSFLRYCLETGRGYNESGRLTVRTLKTYSRILCRIIRDRHGDSAIPPEVSRRLIKTYCQKDLVKLGAETKVHEKSQAGPEVILDMIQYLWALDEHEYHHPRDRLQLAALLQIFMFTGVRPGEIIESGCYRATNRGVLYKDLELQAVRQGTRQRWVAKIRLRHRKGGDGLGENEMTFPLLEDTERRDACPVASLVALAIADGALVGISTVEDLRKVRIKQTRTVENIAIVPDMAEVPIFRASLGRGRAISGSRIVCFDQYQHHLQSVADRAGYNSRFTTYHIRRGHGAVLDNFVSDAVRRKRMGHRDAGTFQAYLSNVSAVDGQSLMLGRETEDGLMKFTQSIAATLDTGRATYPGSRLTDPVRESGKLAKAAFIQTAPKSTCSPDIADLDSNHEVDVKDALVWRPAATLQLQAYLEWDVPRSTLIALRNRSEPVSFEELVSPLVEMAHPQHSHWHYEAAKPSGDDCPSCGKNVARQDGRSWDNVNRHLLSCYMTTMRTRDEDQMKKDLKEIGVCHWADCRYSLAITGATFWRRATRHFEGHLKGGSLRCHWADCIAQFSTEPELRLHILHSHSLPLSDTLPRRYYCFDCRVWFQTLLEWNRHCATHLAVIPEIYCGQVSRRGVVIWAAHCVFCLGDTSLSAADRWAPFKTINSLHTHLLVHLRKTHWPQACPHPIGKCGIITSTEMFWTHLRDGHGIEPFKGKSTGPLSSASEVEEDRPLPDVDSLEDCDGDLDIPDRPSAGCEDDPPTESMNEVIQNWTTWSEPPPEILIPLVQRDGDPDISDALSSGRKDILPM